MEYLPNKYFLSTPSGVGAGFLVDESMFLCTPSVGAACHVGVRDLDLGSMINLSTGVNKT